MMNAIDANTPEHAAIVCHGLKNKWWCGNKNMILE
jgi:hypothetical protein